MNGGLFGRCPWRHSCSIIPDNRITDAVVGCRRNIIWVHLRPGSTCDDNHNVAACAGNNQRIRRLPWVAVQISVTSAAQEVSASVSCCVAEGKHMSQQRRGQDETVPASVDSCGIQSPLILLPSHLQEVRFHRDSGAAKRHPPLFSFHFWTEIKSVD